MKHKTARGRMIDMAALAKANEQVRAVGNVPMNAKGDRLDASGNVSQTVQAKARAQHNTTSAPEKRKLSDVPGNKEAKAKAKRKPAAKKKAEPTGPVVMSETKKTRDDGTSYLEIEYDDGSIDVKELDE